MENTRLRIQKTGREAMAVLAQLRDGDAALLYAYAVCQDGGCTLPQAAQALEFSPEQAKKASQLLLVYGLAVNHTAPPPRQEAAYPAAELAQVRGEDAAFSGLCDYFESQLGRILNRRELETLLNVYQALGLPPEVLTLLMGDCAQRGRLTAREVEKQAYRWYDLGLDNYESAASYLARQRQRQTHGAKVLSILGIHDRLPGESEQKYIDKWEEMGVTEDLLRKAYDATLLGTGRLSWPYLHKVLCAWREQGFRTARDVETGNQKNRPRCRSRWKPLSCVGCRKSVKSGRWRWKNARTGCGSVRPIFPKTKAPCGCAPLKWPGQSPLKRRGWPGNTRAIWDVSRRSCGAWVSRRTGCRISPIVLCAVTGAMWAPRSAGVWKKPCRNRTPQYDKKRPGRMTWPLLF